MVSKYFPIVITLALLVGCNGRDRDEAVEATHKVLGVTSPDLKYGEFTVVNEYACLEVKGKIELQAFLIKLDGRYQLIDTLRSSHKRCVKDVKDI